MPAAAAACPPPTPPAATKQPAHARVHGEAASWTPAQAAADTRAVAALAAVSRVVVLAVAAVAVLVAPEYDSSTTVAALAPPQHAADAACDGAASRMAAALARPLVRWDAVHFVDIAAGGHHFEQQFAFFPGLPLLARALAAPAVAAGVLCRSAALPLAGIVVANASFVAAAVALHRLSLAVLQDRRAARAAAMLFCVNPAGIFMSSVYTESPFALLTFVGMLAMVRGNRLVAAMSWSLATAVRANGILAAGFFVWDAVHPFARQHRSMMQAAAHCALDMLGAAATIAPFVGFQALGWHQFCGSAASPRPWCSRPLPSIYAFVQEHYWDNGFLRYFTPQQAPNFVLAAPIVAISVAGIAHFARQNPAAVLTLGLESSSSAAVLVRLPFVVLWATMLVLCVTSMNVQVIIRFFTSVPAMFWFLGEAVAAHARGRRLSVPVRAALLYFVLYPLAGAVLFSRFLPPA